MGTLASGSIDLKSLKVAGTNATGYITDITSEGIFLSPSNQSPTPESAGNSVKIDGSGLSVFVDNDLVAFYGKTTRIGTQNGARTEITPSQFSIITDSGATAINISSSGKSQTLWKKITLGQSVPLGMTWTYQFSGISNETVVYVDYTVYGAYDYRIRIVMGETTSTTNLYDEWLNIIGTYSFNGTTNTITIFTHEELFIRSCSYQDVIQSPLVEITGDLNVDGEITGTTTKQTISTFSSGWAVYDNGDPVTVRRNGKVVTLTGAVTNTSAVTLNNSTGPTVFTVPVGFKPSQNITIISQGSTTNVFCMRVSASGNVTFERYRNSTSYSSVSAGAWFPFHVTWILD